MQLKLHLHRDLQGAARIAETTTGGFDRSYHRAWDESELELERSFITWCTSACGIMFSIVIANAGRSPKYRTDFALNNATSATFHSGSGKVAQVKTGIKERKRRRPGAADCGARNICRVKP